MSKENKPSNKDLLRKLQQARALLDECIAGLAGGGSTIARTPKKGGVSQQSPSKKSNTMTPNVDFEKPIRAFIKQYAKGLSGPKKFVLLLARLAKGDPKKEVPLQEVETHWRRMKSKSLLGMDFNRFYPAQARENDWVDSKKKGTYTLRPSWQQIFN
jgi:hypothetical protein